MDYVVLNHQILIYELCPVFVIRKDTTHFCCSQNYIFRFLLSEEVGNGFLISQVIGRKRCENKIPVNGASYHSIVTSYIYLTVFFHRVFCVMVLWCYGVMVLWCYGVMVLWCYGVMVLWCYGVMVLWCYGVMVLWCYGVMVLWCYGVMVLWCYGVMVLWCY